MTGSKLIVIWGEENVVSSYIKGSLGGRNYWNVIQISKIEELDQAVNSLPQQPDEIILIGQGNYNALTDETLKIINARQNIKIIMISFDSNVMDVYSKKAVHVTQASDLVSVIDTRPAASENPDIPGAKETGKNQANTHVDNSDGGVQ